MQFKLLSLANSIIVAKGSDPELAAGAITELEALRSFLNEIENATAQRPVYLEFDEDEDSEPEWAEFCQRLQGLILDTDRALEVARAEGVSA